MSKNEKVKEAEVVQVPVKEEFLLISVPQAQALINYFVEKPYREANGYIDMLISLPKAELSLD